MTRQEAARIITVILDCCKGKEEDYEEHEIIPLEESFKALGIAIQALEQEPTAECSSDVISREEVKKQTTKKNSIWNTITDSSGRGLDEILDSIPSAQLEHKTDGDTISRQAAIRWVKTECNPYGNPTLDFESGKKVIEHLKQMPSAQPFTTGQIQTMQELESAQIEKAYELGKADRPKWIPCSERLPECEQEVLICTEKKLVGKDAYIDSIITPAIYEDGTMLEVESMWHWDDIDFDEWDDTEDCGIIPMGWFENRHFIPDEVYNNPVDRKVVAWMPLPEAYREDGEEE